MSASIFVVFVDTEWGLLEYGNLEDNTYDNPAGSEEHDRSNQMNETSSEDTVPRPEENWLG